MLRLAAPTRPGWIDEAVAHVDEVLVDHAHCEKKAAATAVGFLFRYPQHTALLAPLSALAREELEHFELVLDVLHRRGVRFEKQLPSPYAERLHVAVRRVEPDRLLDSLLACALIEARSCERMKLLADHLPDAELAGLYRSLLASEARHFQLYVELASELCGRDATRTRLGELAEHEAACLVEPGPEPRVHS